MNYLKDKQNLFLLMLICFSISAFGQNMYVSANVGYGIGISPLTFTNYAPIQGSLGKGSSINTAFGFVFGKHLGAEFNISYLLGGKVGIQESADQTSLDYHFSARMLNLMPSHCDSNRRQKNKTLCQVWVCGVQRRNSKRHYLK